jgi:hypothetical protein
MQLEHDGEPVSRARGQALAETALVLPVFFLLLLGLVDGARLVFTDSTLSQAARVGARVASVEANWVLPAPGPAGCVTSEGAITPAQPGAHVCPPDVAHLKADVVAAVNRMVGGVGPVTAVYLSCNAGTADDPAPSGAWTESPGASSPGGNGCEDAALNAVAQSGWIVSVRLTYTYSPITPVVSAIWPSFGQSASATMVVN